MKKILLSSFLLCLGHFLGAQKIYTSGTIYTDIESMYGTMQLPLTSITTTLKEKKLKVLQSSISSETLSILDNVEKKLTMQVKVLGKKIGFTSVLPDTIIASKDCSIKLVDSSQIINGFNCLKASINYTSTNETRLPVVVWYTPDFKFSDSTLGINIEGIEKIPGLPIQIETKTQRGISMKFVVKKIDLETIIKDEAFIIPKGFEMMSEADFKKKIADIQTGKG